VGCKSGKQTASTSLPWEQPQQARKTPAKPTEQDRIDFDNLFFNANKEKILGNPDAALQLFMKCAVKNPNNDAVLYNIAQIYSQQKKDSQALPYIKAAVKINPSNTYYQELLGELYIRNKMYEEAVGVYQKLSKDHPDELQYQYQSATALIYAGKYADAIKMYDKMEEKMGINPEVVQGKQRLYLKLGKVDKAAEEVEKLIKAFPNQVEYYGMLAEMYQANNMGDKALVLYEKMQTIDPDNGYVHLSLADYYRDKKQDDKAFEELKKAFSSKGLEIETKLKILASFFTLIENNPKLKEQALELNKLLIEAHPKDAQAHTFYAEFLYQDKKLEQARDEFAKSIAIDKQSFNVWRQLLSVEVDLKDFVAVEMHSEEAITLFPTQPFLFFFNGVAKMQLKHYRPAIDKLKEGLELVVDNNPLKAEFFANIAEAYYQLKNYQASDVAFDKCIILDGKNANAMNNFSYYLSLRGDSLDKAERYSKRSNELEPNNSYYQDTYAWVLYKLARYPEAKEWLEKAMASREGASSTIMEHYGDVLFKLGDTAKAVEYWEKARKAGANSDLLQKKIAERKLFE
jgi:tetratricopeptide (TPR) repeat protein